MRVLVRLRLKRARPTAPVPPAAESVPASPSGVDHPPSHPASAIATPPISPEEALFREEVARMRVFSVLALLVCAIVLCGFPFLGGDPLLKTITMVGAGLSVLSGLWIITVYRDPARYDQRAITLWATLSIVFAYSGVLYWGIFSPAPMLILFGFYFFARSQRLPAALYIYVLAALIQGGAAILTVGGFVPDPGLLTAEAAPLHIRAVTQIIIQVIFLAVFLFARSSREGTLQAMEELVRAQRQAAQREAAFQELRQDLDRVLEVGGAGHFTDRLLGRWRLGAVIGRGAMGEVYEATIDGGQDRAAVKLLHPNVLAKPSSVERFLREARAASSIDSPHAVQVYEAGQSPVPFLVMELLRGRDLAYYLRERRRFPLPELTVLLAQVGSLIDAASSRGIVHRDLKPQNLFCADRPSMPAVWKVLDFGASKLADSSGSLTQGRVVGTPSYMSPQQARGEDVDGAADRYSLAAIAYRCTTGRPPFAGPDLPTTLYRVVYGTPPPPSALGDVPPGIDDVLAVGLAKDPDERFTSGAELADAFAHAAAGHRPPELQRRAARLLERHPWGITPS